LLKYLTQSTIPLIIPKVVEVDAVVGVLIRVCTIDGSIRGKLRSIDIIRN